MLNLYKKPTVPSVLPMVKEYCRNHAGCGSLHIVLQDQNVNDSHVIFCLNAAKESNDLDGVILAKLLLMMSKTQRLKISKNI